MNILKKVSLGALFVAVFVGLWILFDFIFSEFITGSGFTFAATDIIYPAVLAIAIYLVIFVFANKKKSK